MLDAAEVTTHDDTDTRAPNPRVLIAVDDTPAGRRTLASGLVQAAARRADVTVLHVTAPRRWRTGRIGPIRAVPMRLRNPLDSAVLRDARRLALEHGVQPRLELVATDDVDGATIGLARRIGAETIVVGASRPDRLTAPLGVCQGVLRHAPVPVVVVRA